MIIVSVFNSIKIQVLIIVSEDTDNKIEMKKTGRVK